MQLLVIVTVIYTYIAGDHLGVVASVNDTRN